MIITAGLVGCFQDIEYLHINHFFRNKTFWAVGLVLTFEKSDYYPWGAWSRKLRTNLLLPPLWKRAA